MQTNVPKAFTRAQTASLELFTNAGNTVLNSAGKIAPLGLEAIRSALNEAATLANTVQHAKTPQDLVNLQSNFAESVRDNATTFGRTVYEIATETQTKLQSLFDAHVSEFQATVNEAIEQTSSMFPSSAGGMADFFKSIAVANAKTYQDATETLRKTAEATVSKTVDAVAPAAARKGKA
jgi:phasin family protein